MEIVALIMTPSTVLVNRAPVLPPGGPRRRCLKQDEHENR